MSGECDSCGWHTTECICTTKDNLIMSDHDPIVRQRFNVLMFKLKVAELIDDYVYHQDEGIPFQMALSALRTLCKELDSYEGEE